MSPTQPLRCARCGIESLERTCFIFPRACRTSSRDLRCITCEQSELSKAGPWLGPGVRLLAGLLWPLPLLALTGQPQYLQPLLIVAVVASLLVLLVPTAIAAHELGHALAACLLGLEVARVDIGHGPAVAHFELGGVTIQLNARPLSGGVSIGASSLRLLRARVWLMTLMGPAANAALLVLTLLWWHSLQALVNPLVLLLWVIINSVMLYVALWPVRTVAQGRVRLSDGLALMKIPFLRREQLKFCLLSALLTRAVARLECEDFEGAQHWLLKALERVPAEVGLTVTLAGCHCLAGEYPRAIALLTPLMTFLKGAPATPARQRAAIYHHMAFALLMTYAGKSGCGSRIDEADRLSAAAFAMFPCVLAYRNTRALVLFVKNRAADALPLLDYVHYGAAPARQAAQREVARALVLSALGKDLQAREAAARAVQLHGTSHQWLSVLGAGTFAASHGANGSAA